MKYAEQQNYWKGFLFAIVVIALTYFFVNPISFNSQDKDCFDTGRGLICE